MKSLLSVTVLGALVAVVTGCETSNQNYSGSDRVIDVTQSRGPSVESVGPVYSQSNQQPPRQQPQYQQPQYQQPQYQGGQQTAQRPNYQQGPGALTDAPYEGNVSSYPPSNQGYTQAGVNQSSPVANNAANNAGTIIYTGAPGPYGNGALNNGQPNVVQDPNKPKLQYQGSVAYDIEPIRPLPNVPQPQYGQIQQYNPTYGNSNNQPPANTAPPKEENLASSSTSSGNWLLVGSEAAVQDENITAEAQKVIASQQKPSSSSVTVYENSIATTAGPDKYRVVKGDTLYSIAFRYGLDYHALANINKIQPPYNLSVGQVLTLNLKASAAPEYVVKPGDTLYSIAHKYGQSVAFLAGVNNLQPPYNLTLGQKIKLSRDTAVKNEAAANKENMEVPVAGQQSAIASNKPTSSSSSSSSTAKPAPSAPAAQKVPAIAQTPIVNTKTRTVGGVTWSWPTSGKVIEQFSTAEQGNKGVDIAGQRGQAILSAADGQVVYSGNALRGFGNLLIINHSNEFLSAYAHNEVLLVKEGQRVKRGQQIARMGNTDASSVRLHFEIRYRGQSVNPVSYLPK